MLYMESTVSYHDRKWEYELSEIAAEIMQLRAEIESLKSALATAPAEVPVAMAA